VFPFGKGPWRSFRHALGVVGRPLRRASTDASVELAEEFDVALRQEALHRVAELLVALRPLSK